MHPNISFSDSPQYCVLRKLSHSTWLKLASTIQHHYADFSLSLTETAQLVGSFIWCCHYRSRVFWWAAVVSMYGFVYRMAQGSCVSDTGSLYLAGWMTFCARHSLDLRLLFIHLSALLSRPSSWHCTANALYIWCKTRRLDQWGCTFCPILWYKVPLLSLDTSV